LDGWTSGHGITGNSNESGGNNAPELTGLDLFLSAISLEEHLQEICGHATHSTFKKGEKEEIVIAPQSLHQPKAAPHRRRAVEFFDYQDDERKEIDEEEVDESRTKSRVDLNSSITEKVSSSPSEEVNDGLVYSRVHGYRIKVDHQEDTSLAYKKVLGDIKVLNCHVPTLHPSFFL
jgi:hypothetical protein